MTDLQKAGAALAVFVVLSLGYVVWRNAERGAGARAVVTQQSDSTHTVRVDTQHVDSLAAVRARALAQDSLRKAQASVRAAEALASRTDSAARRAATERDSARRVLADSQATMAQLRAELERVVETSTAQAIADSLQHVADQRAIRDLTAAQSALLDAQAAGIKAENAAVARAVASEHTVALQKQQLPSTAGNIVRGLLYFAAGVGVGHLTR